MRQRIITSVFTFVALLYLWPYFALAHEESLRVSRVVGVFDGDTVSIDIDGLPVVFGKTLSVRLQGIDTPEKHPRVPFCNWEKGAAYDACKAKQRHAVCERSMAQAAQQALKAFIDQGTELTLVNMERDKYFRLNADLLVDGKSASQHMIATGHARPYSGDEARQPWQCKED